MDTENFVANWETLTSQEDTRVKNMHPETSASHKKTRTSQEDMRVQNMDPEEEYDHWSRHAALERTISHNLSIQQQLRTRDQHTQQESCRVVAMNEARRSIYNDQKSTDQLNHRKCWGPEILVEDDV